MMRCPPQQATAKSTQVNKQSFDINHLHQIRPAKAPFIGKASMQRSATAAPPPSAAAATTAAAPAPATAAAAMSNAPSEAARRVLGGTAEEQVEEVEATVTGAIPAWLTGSLVVNGGGDYAQMEHMFDGYALVVKARFKGGRAWGRQRYLDTAAYRAFKESGRVVFREFATAPQPSGPLDALRTAARDLLGILTNNSQFTDNASVNLHSVGARRDGGANGAANSRTAPRKQLLATSETPKASYLVDPLTLATAAPAKFNDGVKGDLTTAHPTVLSDGRLLNFTRTLPFGGFNLFTLDPDTLTRAPVAFVADRRPLSPAWLHDFPANDEYAVIVENPLYMSLGSLLFGSPRPYVFMDWKPEDGTLVTVVRLDGSEPHRVFKAPPFFAFHYGACYVATDAATGARSLVVDMAAYDDPTIVNDLRLAPLREPRAEVSRSYYKRLTVPLGPGAPAELPLEHLTADPEANAFCEFPSINPAYYGKPYRYAYALAAARPTNVGNALSKIDVQTGATVTWHERGAFVGEPMFVAKPGATAEDDGVVLTPGVDAEGRTFVVALDGASFKELGRATFPFGTPYRFHGIWLEGDE